MGEHEAPYRIEESAFGRWIIVSRRDPGLAWSGSRWVEHQNGIPTRGIQISNFFTREEALDFAFQKWNC